MQMGLPGASLILAAVVCYTLALQDGGVSRSWNSSTVIGLLVGFVLITATFVVVEYFRKDRALLLGRLMNDRTMIVGCAFLFL
jgi:hypothetical protein